MKRMKRLLLIPGVIAGLCISAPAQINNTLFFMQGVPQSNRVNPAIRPDCGFYIGFPFLAPFRTELSSSSLAYKDIIYPHPTEDSLITFMHPLGDKQAFLDRLKPVNFLASGLGSAMLSMGVRTKAGFFFLDVTTRWEGNIYYPGDLARLLIEGAEEGRTYTLDGIGLDVSVFDEISAGWSYPLMDNLDIGARVKMLFGVGNLSTRNSDLALTTSQDVWNIRSDMTFNASLPFADVVYDEDGKIDEIIVNEDLKDFHPSTLPGYMFNGKNLGLGLDIGAVYRPVEQLQVSLSLTDLGYVRWTDEVHQVDYTMEYDFNGIEVNPFEFKDDFTFGDYMDSTLSQMADSLSGFLVFTEGAVYSRRLNTKIYAGVSYELTPLIGFGLLSRTDLLRGKVAEQVTASANFRASRLLNLTLSYSYINSYFKNIGIGFSSSLGPFNLYLVSDNALNTIFWPEETRSTNLWFGLNLMFGYRHKVDLPLIY
jgi:hypothetical protein